MCVGGWLLEVTVSVMQEQVHTQIKGGVFIKDVCVGWGVFTKGEAAIRWYNRGLMIGAISESHVHQGLWCNSLTDTGREKRQH